MNYFDQPIVRSFLPEKAQSRGLVEERVSDKETPLVERLREGLPLAEFHALRDLLVLPEEELGRLLGISPATLGRRKKSKHLSTNESERIVRFARLFGQAFELFESEESAREWLKTPNPGTAGETPLSYADTEFGAREVENLIGRIAYGGGF